MKGSERDNETAIREIRFRAVRRGEYFWFKGVKWKRRRGRFATPVHLIRTGHCGECFDIETVVLRDHNNDQPTH